MSPMYSAEDLFIFDFTFSCTMKIYVGPNDFISKIRWHLQQLVGGFSDYILHICIQIIKYKINIE